VPLCAVRCVATRQRSAARALCARTSRACSLAAIFSHRAKVALPASVLRPPCRPERLPRRARPVRARADRGWGPARRPQRRTRAARARTTAAAWRSRSWAARAMRRRPFAPRSPARPAARAFRRPWPAQRRPHAPRSRPRARPAPPPPRAMPRPARTRRCARSAVSACAWPSPASAGGARGRRVAAAEPHGAGACRRWVRDERCGGWGGVALALVYAHTRWQQAGVIGLGPAPWRPAACWRTALCCWSGTRRSTEAAINSSPARRRSVRRRRRARPSARRKHGRRRSAAAPQRLTRRPTCAAARRHRPRRAARAPRLAPCTSQLQDGGRFRVRARRAAGPAAPSPGAEAPAVHLARGLGGAAPGGGQRQRHARRCALRLGRRRRQRDGGRRGRGQRRRAAAWRRRLLRDAGRGAGRGRRRDSPRVLAAGHADAPGQGRQRRGVCAGAPAAPPCAPCAPVCAGPGELGRSARLPCGSGLCVSPDTMQGECSMAIRWVDGGSACAGADSPEQHRVSMTQPCAEPAAGRARAQVRTAYEVLSDPLLRALYDTKLSAGGRSGDLDDSAAAPAVNGACAWRPRAPSALRPPLAPSSMTANALDIISSAAAGQPRICMPDSASPGNAGSTPCGGAPGPRCSGMRRGDRSAGDAAGTPSDGGADEPMEAEEAFAQRQREAAVVAHKDGRTAFWAGAQTLGFSARVHRLLGQCEQHTDTVRQRDRQHAASNVHRRVLRARASPAPRRGGQAGLVAAHLMAAAEHGCCCLRYAALLRACGAPASGVQVHLRWHQSAERAAPARALSSTCARQEGGRALGARAQAMRARRWSTSRRPSARSAARRARPTPTATPPPPPGRPSWSAAARTSRSRRRAPVAGAARRRAAAPAGDVLWPAAPASH